MRSLLAALFAFGCQTHADEIVRWRMTPTNIEYRVLHKEGAVTMVELFVKRPGHLQDVKESLTFKSSSEARRVFDRLTKDFDTGTPPGNPQQKSDPGAAVWIAENAWSEAWEDTYREWIKANATSDFLFDHGVATDCADVAYAYRMIFARIFSLPVALKLAGSTDFFTNESESEMWSNLPTDPDWDKDRRFRRALNYLLRNTYTHTLMREFYPVAVNTKYLNSGAVFLDLYDVESGHTQLVRTLITDDPNSPNPLRMLASTVPREVRKLFEYGFHGYEDFPLAGERGFFRFRWAVRSQSGYSVTAPEQMPGYSLEQFSDLEGDSLLTAILHRLLPGWSPDLIRAMRAAVAELSEKLLARVQIVQDGFAFCQTQDCAPGTPAWEIHSTPSRDRALTGIANQINDIYSAEGCEDECWNEFRLHFYDPITETDHGLINLYDAYWAFRDETVSSDPRDPIHRRWGFFN